MTRKLTTEEFKIKAYAVHGDRYNYDDVIYTSMHVNVKINCIDHGSYNQTPGNHLSNKGCSMCANNLKKSNDRFIEEAKLIHGNTFDYSLVEYVNARKKVILICHTHGIFGQTPDKHLRGHGCAKCNTVGNAYANHSPNEPATFYIVRIFNEIESFYKIGVTIRKILKNRFSNIRTLGYKIDYIFSISATLGMVLEEEKKLLHRYKHLQYKPLKKFSGWTECLSVIPTLS